jgi:hypothetical protein
MTRYFCCGPEKIEQAIPLMICFMLIQIVYTIIVMEVLLSNNTIYRLLTFVMVVINLTAIFCLMRLKYVSDVSKLARKYTTWIRMAPMALLSFSVFSFIPCFTGFLEFLGNPSDSSLAVVVFFVSLIQTVVWIHAFWLAMNESNINTIAQNTGDNETEPDAYYNTQPDPHPSPN